MYLEFKAEMLIPSSNGEVYNQVYELENDLFSFLVPVKYDVIVSYGESNIKKGRICQEICGNSL